jgi:polyisoprenoid-binding protein YceI
MGLLWAGIATATEFKIDGVHSAVTFKVTHLTVSKTNGKFGKFDGAWTLDGETGKLKSLEVTVDVESVDTANKDRDDHLRNADFFDAKKHPKMTFKMDRYIETNPGKGKVIGRLTIRGTTKPVELVAEVSKIVDNPFQKGKRKAGISLSGEIRRLDFGVGEKYGDAKIGEKVEIAVDLEGDA